MSVLGSPVLRRAFRALPDPVRRPLRRIALRGGHPDLPAVKGIASVQDLYLWIADGTLDTLLPHPFDPASLTRG